MLETVARRAHLSRVEACAERFSNPLGATRHDIFQPTIPTSGTLSEAFAPMALSSCGEGSLVYLHVRSGETRTSRPAVASIKLGGE